MTKPLKITLSVLMVLLIAAAAILIFTNYTSYLYKQEQEQQALEAQQAAEEENTLPPEPTSTFSFEEPENALNARLTFCGEIIGQSGLVTQAKTAEGGYDFTPILSGVAGYASASDYAVCTMETTLPAVTEYSGYPLLISPVELAAGIKATGFDLVSTATNHAMDAGKEGLDFTITALEQNGLDHIGTYQSQQSRDETQGMVVRDINGIRVVILSYTFGVTDMSALTGIEYAVNTFCNSSWNIDYDKLSDDLSVARAIDHDLIVVMAHWGTEFDTQPTAGQEELTNYFFAQGADVVVGGHSLVPQPIELRKVKDEDGTERTCLVAYGIGSLASCNDDPNTNLSVALNVDIQKNPSTGKTYIRSVSYDPLFMADLEEYGVSADWNFRVLDLRARIADYAGGTDYGIISPEMNTAMVSGLDTIHSIMGEEYDSAGGGVDVMLWNYEND